MPMPVTPMPVTTAREAKAADRFALEVFFRPEAGRGLADDVRWGLSQPQKQLGCKYLYDAHGSDLFDQICDTEEYYPTRTELSLLEQVAGDILAAANPREIVELGSGMARKTRALFDAARSNAARFGAQSGPGRLESYVPIDVSASALTTSAEQLLAEYPWLSIRAIAADYESQLRHVGHAPDRLFLFIGSTLGNFEHRAAVRFLNELGRHMHRDDYFLLGTDLVKDHRVLNAAYNDQAGVTEAFNKNVLTVINRELHANFDLSRFDHHAEFNVRQSQIEMHLVAREAHPVEIGAHNWSVRFAAGETIRTEISRKFTRRTVQQTLAEAGLELVEWFVPENEYFALSLARRAR
jgi:L-histidine N-alpha-methyltransferase